MHHKNINDIVLSELQRINAENAERELISKCSNRAESTAKDGESYREFTLPKPSTGEFQESMYLTRDAVKMTGKICIETKSDQESAEKSNEHLRTKKVSLKELQNMTIIDDVKETTRSQRNSNSPIKQLSERSMQSM